MIYTNSKDIKPYVSSLQSDSFSHSESEQYCSWIDSKTLRTVSDVMTITDNLNTEVFACITDDMKLSVESWMSDCISRNRRKRR